MPNIRYADIPPLFGAPEAFTAFAGKREVEVIGMFHGARVVLGG